MAFLYPYGDSQQLNLSWFLAKFKELYEYVMNLDPGESSMDTILSRFTEQYNPSTTYTAGDYCIFDGYIYKANRATSGMFDSGSWDAALPVNDIQGLRILISELSRTVEDIGEAAVTDVQYTPGAAAADGLLKKTVNGVDSTVMTVDKEPTENSQNPVKSGSVYGKLSEIKGSLNTVETYMAFIINGNKSTTAIPLAQYAIVKNSTIANITDGLYIAAKAIPANTAIDSTYLTAVNSGGFNSIRSATYGQATRDTTNTTAGAVAYFIQNGIVYMQGYVNVANRTFANADIIATNMPKPTGDVFIVCVDANTSDVVPLFLERSTRTLKTVTGFPSAGHYIYFTGCFMYDPS